MKCYLFLLNLDKDAFIRVCILENEFRYVAINYNYCLSSPKRQVILNFYKNREIFLALLYDKKCF